MTEAKATLGKARLGKLIWAEDKQPRSEAFDDVYFSVENGLAESRYVFLVHFISVEKFPLSLADISRAAEAWPELAAYARQLTEHYPPQPWDCVQTIPFASDTSSSVELTLILGPQVLPLPVLRPSPRQVRFAQSLKRVSCLENILGRHLGHIKLQRIPR